MATFTNAQLDSFFINGPQMSLSAPVRDRLALEGLASIDDFDDFKADQLSQAFKNMRTSIPGVNGTAFIPAVQDAQGNELSPAVPATAAIPAIRPVLVSAKCALRLKVASFAYHYYVDVGRTPTPSSMNYSRVLKAFYVEYEALLLMAKEDKPDVPLLHKNLTPIRWIESFKNCLHRTFGIRGYPLLYVIREEEAVEPELDDPLVANAYFGKAESILDETVARLSHTDPLFKSDNAKVYSMLEEATRGGIYASTVKPYSRRKDGRAAWKAMVSSHAGKDKWEQLQKDKMRFLMNTKWNGKTFSLEKFCGIHRTSYVQLEEAAIHVSFQLPNEHSRVGFLIDNIVNSDPDLRAAIASIRVDTQGMRDSFEDSVAFLLPVDPYSKNRANSNNKSNPQISSASVIKNKQSSTTGVDFRWHKPEEYKKLNAEQRKELYEWQQSKEGKATLSKSKSSNKSNSNSSSSNKKLKSEISSLKAKLKEATEVEDDKAELQRIEAVIASVNSKNQTATPTSNSNATIASAALELQKMTKRKRDVSFE